jgi:PAS domain S-box-containing protein
MPGDLRRAERATRGNRIASLVDALGEAIIGVDHHGAIETWSAGASRLLGYTADRIIGRPATMLAAPGGPVMLSSLISAALGGRPLVRSRTVLRHQDGALVKVTLTVAPVAAGRGSPAPGAAIGARRDEAEPPPERAERSRHLHEFAAVASHDLQEPLRKLTGFSEQLLREYTGALGADGAALAGRIHRAAGRMTSLVESIFEWSRAAGAETATDPVDLDEILREVASDAADLLEDTGGTIEAGPLPVIAGDRVQIVRLFQNLVNNAVKFRRPGVPPRVRVDGRAVDNGSVEITVTDNGMGFDDRHAAEIFLPFERLHDRDAIPGSGLGLAICQRIVERHGGRIAAASRPGEGSTFVVQLPASR